MTENEVVVWEGKKIPMSGGCSDVWLGYLMPDWVGIEPKAWRKANG